jgi:hypothetical protein
LSPGFSAQWRQLVAHCDKGSGTFSFNACDGLAGFAGRGKAQALHQQQAVRIDQFEVKLAISLAVLLEQRARHLAGFFGHWGFAGAQIAQAHRLAAQEGRPELPEAVAAAAAPLMAPWWKEATVK